MDAGTYRIAVNELRSRVSGGDLRLPGVPGGPRDHIMVCSDRHAFFIPMQEPDGTGRAGVTAVPRRDLPRRTVLDAVALGALGLMTASWLLAGVGLAVGSLVLPLLFVGGGSAVLFMAAVLVGAVLTSPPEPVEPDHPLAAEALEAMTRAGGLQEAAVVRPSSPRSGAVPVRAPSG